MEHLLYAGHRVLPTTHWYCSYQMRKLRLREGKGLGQGVMLDARIASPPRQPPGRMVSGGRRGRWGPGPYLHKLRAGVCIVQQDLELGAHVEVAPMDRDPGAAGLGAHGRLQQVDQGQLWGGRQVVGPWASPQVCAWQGGLNGGLWPPLPHRRSAPVTCPPWRRSRSPRPRRPLRLGL